jgi:energy-coupling factor transport system ATP-binding protein
MIEFDHLTYSYPEDRTASGGTCSKSDALPRTGPVLRDVSLRIDEGEFVLVVGRSGAGKSTLLRCINGLVPHFYGGTIGGRIRVNGLDPVALQPRRMSGIVGFVFQDPEAQAVVDVVEDELAFALENQGMPPAAMRERVEEVLDQLHIAHLRQRNLSTLSGGERQRVAIAAVLTLRPQVLVLDEPTSQLDPQSAGQVLDTLVRLNHELGLTIVLSEHRLERVVQYADRVFYLPGRGEPPIMGDPRDVLAQIPLVPPLVELGRRLGWSPLPLTVEEARSQLATRNSPHATRHTQLATRNSPHATRHTQHATRRSCWTSRVYTLRTMEHGPCVGWTWPCGAASSWP